MSLTMAKFHAVVSRHYPSYFHEPFSSTTDALSHHRRLGQPSARRKSISGNVEHYSDARL